MRRFFLLLSLSLSLLNGCEKKPRALPAPLPPEDTASALPVPSVSPSEQLKPQVSPSSLLQDLPTPARLPSTDPQGLTQSPWGVVTSVENQATQVGVSLLEAGGNAIDAAVGTALALAVTHPSAGNLGGGGFLLLKKQDQVEAIDFREDSPQALTEENFWAMIRRGARDGAAVGVPGTPAGLYLAHQRHGRLPWAQVVQPAEDLARHGYRVGKRQAQTIQWAASGLRKNPAAQKLFFPGGQAAPAQSQLKNPGLALALERLREQGPSGFYSGETAHDLIQSTGVHGLLTLEDLQNYRAQIREPLSFDYLGVRVITMPPPSGGGVVLLQNLQQLAHLRAEQLPPESSARLHLLAEVSRRAQVARRFEVTAPERLTIEQKKKLEQRWFHPATWFTEHPIQPERATRSSLLHELYPQAQSELENTTHLSVLDRWGNAVSCTVTLSGSFGAQIVTEHTGIVLNNSVASFSSVGNNTPIGGQRTVSSMAPTLALAGPDAYWVLGTPGGDTIPSTLTLLLLRLVADGASLSEATLAPRFHQGFVPDEIGMERSRPLPSTLVAELRSRGHKVRASRSAQGDANSALWVKGIAYALSDPREGGLAAAPQALSD